MTNRYRVVRAPEGWPENLPFRVGWAGHDSDYGVGDEFDREFTADEEADNLASGLLEIVPADYRVVGDSVVYDTSQGDTFTRALTIGEEAHLVAAGHVERLERPAQKPTKTKTKEEAK